MQPPPSTSSPAVSDALPPSARAPSAATPSRRLVPRQFLERVSRALLVRFLTPHEPILAGRYGFSLAALAGSAQTDRAQVEIFWNVLSAAPPDLAALYEELLAVADVATPAGQEILLSRDEARALDHELGAEDCAAIACLDHPALFAVARPQTAGQSQQKSFASFDSSAPRPFPDDPALRVTFKQRMAEELAARGRSTYFDARESRHGKERHIELVYGRLASARDLVGKKDGASHEITAQVTDRSTERAHAVFHDDTLRFDIAGYDWFKQLVRRVLGEVYFGSAEHFQWRSSITLAPLLTLEAALSVEGLAGLQRVELQRLAVDLGGAWVEIGTRNDCMKTAGAGYVHRALADGAPSAATLLLHTSRSRPLLLEIDPPKLKFDRRDPRLVRTVYAYLVARGFMSLPESADPMDGNEPPGGGES
jgi:hypothetical protein